MAGTPSADRAGRASHAEAFDDNRAHLIAVATRILGPGADAEDAVQETWLRYERTDTRGVVDLRAWLTTVVSRICLDLLRSRRSRGEVAWSERADQVDERADPAHEVMMAEQVELALVLVLDSLSPAERVAFVLHDLFAVPFADVATILDRSVEATKQLASRGRRKVGGAGATGPGPAAGTAQHVDAAGSRQQRTALVRAFLQASRTGDLAGLLALLHPDAQLHADAATVRSGAQPEVLGAEAVAATFDGRALAARLALVDGEPAAVWSVGGQPRVLFRFDVAGDRVRRIDMVGDPDVLAGLRVESVEP